ncbi:MAG: hypothetical protein HYZ14_10750 [Bacteroidetes bacterium]|nr:hypothetical protein [Bacteroidota bacterium]
MKKFLSLILLVAPFYGMSQRQASPYLDQDGLECILTWNETSGSSVLYFYQSSTESFAEAPYQLSAAPTGDAGTYAFAPYLDQDGLECVLAWNTTTGKSKLFFYQASTKTFEAAPYQLPENPTGDAGKFYMEPYLDQDGLECVMVTNTTSGVSKLYFYQSSTKTFELAPYQLPAKPTGDEGTFYAMPYLDQDGIECVFAYNSKTGKSVLYYYSVDTKAFEKSPYQLGSLPTGDTGEIHLRPYLDQDGLECVLAFNATTGSSKLYFYQASTKTFEAAPYQLPANPTGDTGKIYFAPYLDQDGLECVLVCNSTTGKSVLYFYQTSTKEFAPAPYQLNTLN